MPGTFLRPCERTHWRDVDLERLDRWAGDHHGLVTLGAARRCGVSTATSYRWFATGPLIAVHRGVARFPGAPVTTAQRIAAAVYACGEGAMASHRSAAQLWEVPRPETDPIDILLPVRALEAAVSGIVVHRPRDRKDLTPVLRQGIRTTNVLRTLCDLGAVDEPGVPAAISSVLLRNVVTPHDLQRAINTHARRGRHGVPALRRALDEWMIHGKPADSVLERAMNDLLLAGFVVVRFTYRAIHQRPQAVADCIRAALERWPARRPRSGRDLSQYREESRPEAGMRGIPRRWGSGGWR